MGIPAEEVLPAVRTGNEWSALRLRTPIFSSQMHRRESRNDFPARLVEVALYLRSPRDHGRPTRPTGPQGSRRPCTGLPSGDVPKPGGKIRIYKPAGFRHPDQPGLASDFGWPDLIRVAWRFWLTRRSRARRLPRSIFLLEPNASFRAPPGPIS